MSKAVLVFDMPRSCNKCPCLHINTFSKTCGAIDEYNKLEKIDVYGLKPDWCPLRKMPNKYDLSGSENDFNDGWSRGYNYCIDIILDVF